MQLFGLVATVALCAGWIVLARDRRQRGTSTLVLAALGCAVVGGLARPRLGPLWGTVMFVAALLAATVLIGWAAARGWPGLVARVRTGEERARRRGW